MIEGIRGKDPQEATRKEQILEAVLTDYQSAGNITKKQKQDLAALLVTRYNLTDDIGGYDADSPVRAAQVERLNKVDEAIKRIVQPESFPTPDPEEPGSDSEEPEDVDNPADPMVDAEDDGLDIDDDLAERSE